MSFEEQRPRPRNEKEEKDEKDREKNEKARPNDSLSGIAWGFALIVVGIILALVTTDAIKDLNWQNGWSLALGAAGIIFLIEAILRLIIPKYRRPVTGSLIFAFILIAIGVGGFWEWAYIWPIIVIGIGVIILTGQFLRR